MSADNCRLCRKNNLKGDESERSSMADGVEQLFIIHRDSLSVMRFLYQELNLKVHLCGKLNYSSEKKKKQVDECISYWTA